MNQVRKSALAVLIVEDVEVKFTEVEAAVRHALNVENCTRATTVVDAQDQLAEREWDLVVLDISMDIADGSAGPTRAGHANLGGLDIIDQMYLTNREAPTVVVTGFDYFPAAKSDLGEVEMLSLADLEGKIRDVVGDFLIGCVRYGVSGWREKFFDLLHRRFTS